MPSVEMSTGQLVTKLREASAAAEERALLEHDPREAQLLLEHAAMLSMAATAHNAASWTQNDSTTLH